MDMSPTTPTMTASPSHALTGHGDGDWISSEPCSTSRTTGLLFFAGCSDEQTKFTFDFKVLLIAPVEVILERLADSEPRTPSASRKATGTACCPTWSGWFLSYATPQTSSSIPQRR